MALTAIWGPMFSFKTSEMLRRLRVAKIAGKRIVCLKHTVDNRFSETRVTTHDGVDIQAVAVTDPSRLDELAGDADVIGIDEFAPFFGEPAVAPVMRLLEAGRDVIANGLALDSDGKPFSEMLSLIAMADTCVFLRAVCGVCKAQDAATKTVSVTAKQGRIHIGGTEAYIALCPSCWWARHGSMTDE